MKNLNNNTASEDNFTPREILMPDNLMSDMDSILSGESNARQTHNSTVNSDSESENVDSSDHSVGLDNTTVSADLTGESDDDDWSNFLAELKAYDVNGNREERTSCRIDLDLSVSLEEIELLGYSRPDILSAMVRLFIKKHFSRLRELRRVKKSIFTPHDARP